MKKLFLNATHTHTAPVTRPGVYDIPKAGVMQPEDYCGFAAERIGEAIEKAWKGRKPGSFTWGLGHAAVAENRRATIRRRPRGDVRQDGPAGFPRPGRLRGPRRGDAVLLE